MHICSRAAILLWIFAAGAVAAEQPISMAPTPLGEQLRKWELEGTAAGNDGDFYDNRDRGHSALDMKLYPQLRKVVYGEADRKANHDLGAQVAIVPRVVFGNSSTKLGSKALGWAMPDRY